MNKDRAEGKGKDIAGRVQRRAGEWTSDTERQAKGAMKQGEGKVQNTWGKVKEIGKKKEEDAKAPRTERPAEDTTMEEDEEERARLRREAS